MMRAASEDKLPILGISDNNSRSLVLHIYNSAPTIEAIKSQITEQYAEISHWITDQSKLYWWMDDLDHLKHSVCDHQHHLYRSKDGYSSNRLEGAFSHLKRMWRGIYHWFSKRYSQLYLDEFSWRWSNFDLSIESRFETLMGCLVWFLPEKYLFLLVFSIFAFRCMVKWPLIEAEIAPAIDIKFSGLV